MNRQETSGARPRADACRHCGAVGHGPGPNPEVVAAAIAMLLLATAVVVLVTGCGARPPAPPPARGTTWIGPRAELGGWDPGEWGCGVR